MHILAGQILAAETNPLVPNLGELVIGTIAFGALVILLLRSAFPAIEKMYAERRDRIEGGLQRAEEAQAEAKRTLEQYREQLAEARHDANRIREEARNQGQAILEELRTRAQEEAARITARGEAQLAAERQQVITQLRAEIGALAVGLASRIVGESLEDQARQSRVVDRFLDGLEAGQVLAASGPQAEPERTP